MNLCLRLIPAAIACLAILPGAAPRSQEDDPVYVEEEKKDFLDKVDRYRAGGDWKGLFDLQSRASQPKNAHKLVRLSGIVPRYVGLIEFLNRKFADLPPQALEFYRNQYDGAAKLQFNNARAAGDRAGLEKVVDTWFYSSRTDEALDLLANLHVEEGRLSLAIHCWSRLLYHYPDSEIPRAVTAARLARAAALSGQESVLDDVRRHVQETGLSGEVIVGDGPMNLGEFLKSLKVDPPPPAPGTTIREPNIVSRGEPGDVRLTAVRPEIRRWSAELVDGGGAGQSRGGGPSANDYPFLPAYARINGYDGCSERIARHRHRRAANSTRAEDGVYFLIPPASRRRGRIRNTGASAGPGRTSA